VRNTFIALGLLAVTVAIAATMATAQDTPTAPTNADGTSACTNVAEADCATVVGCVWLPGYPVPGGKDVPGYCRPAPKPLTARRLPAQ
jgi:hypothetical protein